MKVLVCGGRKFEDARLMRKHLSEVLNSDDIVIHGGATGADAHADAEARALGVHVARVDALWGAYGRSAGPRRNRAMLALKPDKVIAFPGGIGTENCIKQAEALGIDVEEVGWTAAEETQPPIHKEAM